MEVDLAAHRPSGHFDAWYLLSVATHEFELGRTSHLPG